MTQSSRLFASIPLAASLLWAGSAYAAEPLILQNTGPARAAPIDWSKARAFSNPLPAPDASRARAEVRSGRYTPGAKTSSALSVAPGPSTRAYGSFGIPYTSTRVQHRATSYTSINAGPAFLSTTHPYRTVGKLFFTVGGFPSWCSASLIRRSILVTAAHCVQNFGAGNAFFSNWVFRPGHYGAVGATAAQVTPYGAYTWRAIVLSSSWSNGTDTGSGAARNNDVAVIALSPVGGLFAGQRVGYMGYGWNNYSFVSSFRTGDLAVAATSTLGYPALMDSGRIMQRADGPSYLTTVGGSLQIWQGSNFTGGSSGGPWAVNFVSFHPALSGGATIGFGSGLAVVGVTSWGTSDPNAPKDNYSSRFGQNVEFPNPSYGVWGAGNIGALVNALCNLQAGGGLTFAQAGYCS